MSLVGWQIAGVLAWLTLTGFAASMLVSRNFRDLSRTFGRYLGGFLVATVVGQVASMGIETGLSVHTCYFVTLG